MFKRLFKDRRANAIVEFAVTAPFLLLLAAGTFQFGYSFYLYNGLRHGVHLGARYGAVADFDEGGSAFTSAVQNMVVYGTTSPGADTLPIVPNLTTSNVTVTPLEVDSIGIPRRIEVGISSFAVPSIWFDVNFTGKPNATFSYMGQFIAN